MGKNNNSQSKDFMAARNKDIAALSSYKLQKGIAGPSEIYAGSAARYYGGSNGTIKTPALDTYWSSQALRLRLAVDGFQLRARSEK